MKLTVAQYLNFGMSLGKLTLAGQISSSETYEAITSLETFLKIHDFGNAAAALAPLSRSKAGLLQRTDANDRRWQLEPFRCQLHQAANTAVDVALSEAEKRSVRSVSPDLIDPKLRDLEKTVSLTPAQRSLQIETVACIEVCAWRASAVMGWNLMFDVLRWWVFDCPKRLETFQTFLSSGGKIRATVEEYDDFFSLNERSVLDWFRKAQLIPEKRYNMLSEWLHYRNDLAHPNFVNADGLAVVGRLNHLIDVVVGIVT